MSWWFVYVARCADDTLYCGIALDVEARIAEHDAGTGAKYTRGRGPLAVLIVRRCRTKPTALRLEYAVKQLTRREKEGLVANPTGSWRHYRRAASRQQLPVNGRERRCAS
jgi:predicted GIY-YIG superfamily endonuclease